MVMIMNQFSDKKVLVIGGEGFIGQHLVSKLNDFHAEVISLGVKTRVDTIAKEYLAVDIRDKNKLEKILKHYDFDYVFNLGGYIEHSPYSEHGRDVMDVHYVGLLNLLGQINSSKLKCFVHIGSSDEYGGAPSPQNEALREAAISPYSAAKVAGTHLIQALARSEGFPGVVVRPFLTYGPGQDISRFIPQVISGCLNNTSFPVSEGEQLRDFCYVDDVVQGMLLAASTKAAFGEVINIASGIPVSVRSVIEAVKNIIGKGEPIWGAVEYRPGENMRLYADIDKAKKILKWQAKISLKDGLIKTANYYKSLQVY